LGTIEIDLAVNNDLVKLLIIDDGVGMPPIQNDGHSIGLTVIEALSDQLDAKHNFKNTGNGTCFQLDFKYP
jgi:two-component sensor histidine kinase